MVVQAQALVVETRSLPQCWGHRGASGRFPENTLASFQGAIDDGCEAIETDVHLSADGVPLMFHDPVLIRTTGSHGQIKERNWFGEDGMQHLRTIKEPRQPIPTFSETLALLMEPQNHQVILNVDVKIQNDPEKLFEKLHQIISEQDDWETLLAPRLVLSLWHPKFIPWAKTHLPYCRRCHLGIDVTIARRYFWEDCDSFAFKFFSLVGSDGQQFMKDCKASNKKIYVWTPNDRETMMEAVRWGVDAIITDETRLYLGLRAALQLDYDKIEAEHGRLFLWKNPAYYWVALMVSLRISQRWLVSVGGPFEVDMDMCSE